MGPKKRQKLCQNCEGEVDLDVIVCPFCAADLREARPEFEKAFSQPILPPKEALYPTQDSKVVEGEEALVNIAEEKSKSIIAPTIFFTLGVQLLLLGLLILLFSHKGVIILRWEARFWFLYIFASIPFLIFGYRALSKIS